MDDPTDRDPANFPGNPNPPPKIPDTSGIKTSSAPADKTSAGTGALPPSAAAGDVPPSTAAAPADTFRVYTEPDGKHSIFQLKPDGSGDRVGTASADDTQKILDTVGQFNESTKSWDVPAEVAKSLMQGKLPLPEYIAAKWSGGEQGAVRGMIGQKFLAGEFTPEDAISRGNPELLSSQLKEAPIFAWQGGFGATVAKMWQDAKAAGLGGILRRGAGEVAQATPELLNMGSEAAKDAGIIGGGVALMALAAGTTGPAAPAVLAAAGGAVGLNYGLFKHTLDNSAGNTALDMLSKGYEPDTVKTMAPLAGAINGALMIGQFKFMTAGMQRSFIGKVLDSDSVKGMIARYIVDAGKGTTLATAQEAVNIAVNNIAAVVDNKPEGLNQQPIEDLVNAALTAAPVMAAMGIAGAALEHATGRAGEPGAGPESAAQDQALGPNGELRTSEAAASRSASGTVEGASSPDRGIERPLPESVTTHPDFVKAAEEAQPYLPEGVKPEDRAGVAAEADKAVAEHASLSAEIQKALKSEDFGTPENLAGLSARAEDVLEKINALGKLQETTENVRAEVAPGADNQYVIDRPFDLKPKETDKATAQDIREQFSGIKNEQIVRGTQLANELRRDVPDPAQRQGMFWFKAAEGNEAVLKEALADPDLEKYHEQIKAALNLSPEAIKALEKVDRYYKESGQVSTDIGTIRNVLENYQNRIYEPEKANHAVKSETAAGLKQTTSHAKQRVFDTELDAARAGKTFATTDVADALSIHNEEMARVNTARKMADAMAESKLGAWKQQGNVPEGWEQVGTLQKDVPLKGKDGQALIGEDGNQVHSRSVFVAPEGIAKGLAAIADPNFTKKIDSLRSVQRFQGLVKTVDLSFSFFHHLSMLAQTVYQRDLSTLMKLPDMENVLNTPEFLENERDFALHGGMTASVEGNSDILRHLTQNTGDTFSDIVNAPGVKQVLEQVDKNADFLFGKMQRLMKTNNYAQMAADWVADHPDATNAEVLEAKRGFARHVNSVYGGLNWEAMGMTKSNLSLLRLGLLAPDWTISNIGLLKQAIGEKGTAGNASRAHILSALTIGIVGTEAMNKMLTGHFTDQNPSGHKLEVEISPDVYVSLLRGGIGDISKFASMVAESGLGGVARFVQAKGAPVVRTAEGLLTNTQYTGRPIVPRGAGPVAGTYDVLKYALQNLGPMPLGISNLLQYAKSDQPTVRGAAAVGTGVGRFSTGGKAKQE